jgi:hypothetical protein
MLVHKQFMGLIIVLRCRLMDDDQLPFAWPISWIFQEFFLALILILHLPCP